MDSSDEDYGPTLPETRPSHLLSAELVQSIKIRILMHLSALQVSRMRLVHPEWAVTGESEGDPNLCLPAFAADSCRVRQNAGVTSTPGTSLRNAASRKSSPGRRYA